MYNILTILFIYKKIKLDSIRIEIVFSKKKAAALVLAFFFINLLYNIILFFSMHLQFFFEIHIQKVRFSVFLEFDCLSTSLHSQIVG